MKLQPLAGDRHFPEYFFLLSLSPTNSTHFRCLRIVEMRIDGFWFQENKLHQQPQRQESPSEEH